MERAVGLALATALPVESDGEAMRFVANLLDQMQYGGVALQNDGFVLLAENEEDLVFLGDAGHGLIDDLERLERLGSGVQLADAAVDEDEARQFPLLFLQAPITTSDRFAHAGEIIVEARQCAVAGLGAFPVSVVTTNYEFAVLGFFNASVFPNDHGGNGVGPLNVRNIEA